MKKLVNVIYKRDKKKRKAVEKSGEMRYKVRKEEREKEKSGKS